MDPVSMAMTTAKFVGGIAKTYGPYIAAAGTGIEAYSQYQYGQAVEKQYKKSAAIAEEEARRAKEIAGEQAREKRREAKRLKGKQIALYAKSGVMPGTGTPFLVTKKSVEQMERQARIISEQGQYAYGLGMSEADLLRSTGRAMSKRAKWQMGTTLATGFSGLGRSLLKRKW